MSIVEASSDVSRGDGISRAVGASARENGFVVKGQPQPSDEPRTAGRFVRRLVHAPAVWAMIWPAILVIGGYAAWQNWGATHVSRAFYSIDPARIHVTQRPEYIRSDISETVYADMRLDQLSLLDPSATARIASAFATHPWVKNVVAVRKLPGGEVDVHLQYRKPAAMVFVISRHPEIKGRSFFAVDDEGVLLPTTEFDRQATQQYIHIEVPDVYPTGGVGSSFGDSRIVGAAKLAATLEPLRTELRIKSIRLNANSRTAPVPQYDFLSKDGREFFWGSPPGEELHGEPNALAKLQNLIAKVEGSPDSELAESATANSMTLPQTPQVGGATLALPTSSNR